MREEEKWWKNLSEESEKIRVKINGLHNFLVGKCLNLLVLTLIIFVCVVSLSIIFISSSIVLDVVTTIGHIFLVIFFFELGILFSLMLSDGLIDNTFKAYALENQKKKEYKK